MPLADAILAELEREGKSTARILERVPSANVDWKPHPKSRSLGQLAWHIANIPANAVRSLREGRVEVGVARPPSLPDGETDFAGVFQRNLEALRNALGETSDATLMERFSFTRQGEPVLSFPKLGMIRTVMLNHIYHHRGQLTVYLRMLDVAVPAIYGSSADEDAFANR
jgi:uncharacterized damage-inducible protein DinB